MPRSIRHNSHQPIYDRHLLTGFYGYMAAREYYEERFLECRERGFAGDMKLGIFGLWSGNILAIVVRGQLLYVVRRCPVPTSLTPTPPLHTLLHVPSVFLWPLMKKI